MTISSKRLVVLLILQAIIKQCISMKFNIGDKAQKQKGYKFDSIIVAVFKNIEGKTRLVANNKGGYERKN